MDARDLADGVEDPELVSDHRQRCDTFQVTRQGEASRRVVEQYRHARLDKAARVQCYGVFLGLHSVHPVRDVALEDRRRLGRYPAPEPADHALVLKFGEIPVHGHNADTKTAR